MATGMYQVNYHIDGQTFSMIIVFIIGNIGSLHWFMYLLFLFWFTVRFRTNNLCQDLILSIRYLVIVLIHTCTNSIQRNIVEIAERLDDWDKRWKSIKYI